MPRNWLRQARSSGTDRSACSRKSPMRRARRRSRAPSPKPGDSRSRAAATPWRRSTSTASRTRSTMSRQRVARFSNFWKERHFPRSRPSRTGRMVRQFSVETRGQGLYDITPKVQSFVSDSSVAEGLCTVFVRHTSASLVIQENADPSAKRDLERWIARLVPEGDPFYTHDTEGPDDMPAHIRAALTATALSIPVVDRALALGTWQGIYLWEHRRRGS